MHNENWYAGLYSVNGDSDRWEFGTFALDEDLAISVMVAARKDDRNICQSAYWKGMKIPTLAVGRPSLLLATMESR
jgi:hypothetical protein